MLAVAIKNIVRNRRRLSISLFLVFSGTFLVAFMRFLTYGFNQDMIANAVSLDSGFVEIAAYGWNKKRSLRRALEVKPELLRHIRSLGDSRGASLRIRSGGLLSFRDKTRFLSVLAADPEKEKLITTIHRTIQKGAAPRESADLPEAMIGMRLARALGMKPGDEFYLVSSQFDGSIGALKFRLSGVYDSKNAALDSSRVFITLGAGEELFGARLEGKMFYTSIALGVRDYLLAEKLKKELEKRYPVPVDPSGLKPENSEIFSPVVLGWRELNPGITELLKVASWKMDIFFALFVVSISFGVLNSVQMSIQERLRQFGIMLAIGTRTRDLFKLLAWEILLLLVPGTVLGILFAGLLGRYFSANPIILTGDMAEIYVAMGYLPRWRPIVSPDEVLRALVGMIVPAFLISLISARRIFKLNPLKVINIM